MPKLFSIPFLLAVVAWTARGAAASECDPASGLSPCVDADPLWVPAGEARFAAISAARAAPPGVLSFGMAATFLSKPVVLQVASPDPDGRRVQVVSSALNVTPLFAIGVIHALELTLATPMGLVQRGAGIEGITTQTGYPLASNSVRDPRIGFGYALALSRPWLLTKLKLELKLPLGDERAFAGEDSIVAAPSLVLDAHRGRFRAGLELGVRLRSPTELAGVELGNQAFAALGVRFDFLPDERLSLGVEAWALPSLGTQPAAQAGEAVTDASYVSSEWLASLGSALVPKSDVYVLVGAGAALPLSSETRQAADGTTHTESFAGLGTPAFRAILGIRYVPSGGAND